MTTANRTKETTTATNTATLTLAGAPGDYRSFASSFAAGTQNIEIFVGPDSAGKWIIGEYTLTDSVTLTRTAILDSSAAGADLTLAAGIKDAFATSEASSLRASLINVFDPGFDIVLCAGQSNMVGLNSRDANIDIADPRVFQFSAYSGNSATYQKITAAVDPLYYPYEVNGVSPGVGPASWFSKTYAGMVPSNRKVLLVPVAQGGMSMVYAGGSEVKWAPGNPGGTLYELAISHANAAIAAAVIMYPKSRFVGTIWLQGESDADWTIPSADYAAALRTLIAGFRSRIAGAANSWFIIGGMVPEAIAAPNHPGYPAVDAAHKLVASDTARCAFVAGPSDYVGEVPGQTPLHYNGHGARIVGCRMAAAVPAAKRNSGAPDLIAPTVSAAAVANSAPTIVALTASEFLDANYVPAASAFTVGGHAVSSVAISGTVINLTCSTPFVNGEAARQVAYTQPGANQIRDVAGNLLAAFSGRSITNNVAAADTVAPAFASAQVANSQPAVIVVTMNETLAASVPPNSAFSPSGGRTVTGVAINGTVASVTVNTPYANGDTVAIAYTKPGTNPRLQDAAGNATETFAAQAVTNNIAASSGGNALRFADLYSMQETSASAPYAYAGGTQAQPGGTGYSGYTPIGGTSVKSLAADGSVTVQIGDGQGKPMLALKATAATTGFQNLDCVMLADTAAYIKLGIVGGAAGASNVVPAAGDLMRMTRAGSTVVAAVSKNGTDWATIFTFNNVAAGVMYAQILIENNGTLLNPVHVGFA